MTDDPRLTHEAAGVMHVGLLGASCRRCRFWKHNQTCDLVKGTLHATDCCNGYELADGERNSFAFADGSAFESAVEAARKGD